MQVTANAGGRTVVVVPLARPVEEKRRSLNLDAHSSTECIPEKAAPALSPIVSGELSEAEAIRRARDGDRTVFEFLRINTPAMQPVDRLKQRILLKKLFCFCSAKFTPSVANLPSLLGCTG
jgi:hypothetical protein